MDLFFKLLWRHVFTVELIKKKYHITTEHAKSSFLERIKGSIIRDKKKERAVNYLLKWGDKFWEPTEYRIKEITDKIEDELKGCLSGKILPGEIKLTAGSKLSEEQKIEVVHRGQSVINNIQLRELTDVLEFLDEDIFHDEKQNFYLCIDRLDENWVDEKFRYLLIRSLIETVRDFICVRNVKIVVVLRTDLIERVFRLTRDSGFQEEKYRSLYLPIRWNENQLKTLLDKRVNFLVSQTYTRKPVGYKDILPTKVINKDALEYLLERTFMRPRDLIEFINRCIDQSEDHPTITQSMLLKGAQSVFSGQ